VLVWALLQVLVWVDVHADSCQRQPLLGALHVPAEED
jgi:hypothetical protein